MMLIRNLTLLSMLTGMNYCRCCVPLVLVQNLMGESWLTLTEILHKGVISKTELSVGADVINVSMMVGILLEADRFREINRGIVQYIRPQYMQIKCMEQETTIVHRPI
jgi:hypothetical protein